MAANIFLQWSCWRVLVNCENNCNYYELHGHSYTCIDHHFCIANIYTMSAMYVNYLNPHPSL